MKTLFNSYTAHRTPHTAHRTPHTAHRTFALFLFLLISHVMVAQSYSPATQQKTTVGLPPASQIYLKEFSNTTFDSVHSPNNLALSPTPLVPDIELAADCYTQQDGYLKLLKFVNNYWLCNVFGPCHPVFPNPQSLKMRIKIPGTANYTPYFPVSWANTQLYVDVSALLIPYSVANQSYDIEFAHFYYNGSVPHPWSDPLSISNLCREPFNPCDATFQVQTSMNTSGQYVLDLFPTNPYAMFTVIDDNTQQVIYQGAATSVILNKSQCYRVYCLVNTGTPGVKETGIFEESSSCKRNETHLF